MRTVGRLKRAVAFVMAFFLLTGTLSSDVYAAGYEPAAASTEYASEDTAGIVQDVDVSGEDVYAADVSGEDEEVTVSGNDDEIISDVYSGDSEETVEEEETSDVSGTEEVQEAVVTLETVDVTGNDDMDNEVTEEEYADVSESDFEVENEDAGIENKDVYVSVPKDCMTIRASVDSRICQPEPTSTEEEHIYSVPAGKTLTIEVSPKANAKIEGAYINGSTKKQALKNGKLSVKITGLTEIVFAATEKSTAVLATEGMGHYDPLSAGKNGYKVNYNGQYYAYIEGLSSRKVEISSFSLLCGKTDLTSTEVVTNPGAMLGINLSKLEDKYQGKTLTLKMKYMLNGKEQSSSMKLVLDYPITSVTVSGAKFVTDHYELVQPAGTTKTYTVTTNNKGKVDLSKLRFKVGSSDLGKSFVEDNNGYGVAITFDESTGKLTVSSDTFYHPEGNFNKSNGVPIKFYYDGYPLDNKYKLEIWRETKTLSKTTPSFKTVAATDRTIDLKFSYPQGFGGNTDGLFWVIDAQAVTTSKSPLADHMSETVNKVVRASSLVNDTYSLLLCPDSVKEGEGKAQKYKVSARLVQCYLPDAAETAPNYRQYILKDRDEISAESKSKTITASTQNPYYDTKITVKKVTSTVTQGQSDVLVARLENSSKATYKNRFGLVSSSNYRIIVNEAALKNGELRVTPSLSDSYASSMGDTTCTVTVKAYNDGKTKDTTASYTFKVVGGVGEIKLTTPSPTLYKAAGKAAKISVSTKLTSYWRCDIKPTTKNVRYEIVDKNGNGVDSTSMNSHLREAVEKKWITVSQGKVTVASGYLFSADSDENIFCVKAVSVAEETISCVSDPITIVSEAQKIAEIRWIDTSDELGWSVDPAKRNENNGKKKIDLKVDNPYYASARLTGVLVAVDSNGNVINDVKYESKGVAFKEVITFTDYDGYQGFWFDTGAVKKGKYVIKASTVNGISSSKSYSFEVNVSGGFYSYNITAMDGNLVSTGYYDSSSNTSSYINKLYSPLQITVEPRFGASKDTKLNIKGGKQASVTNKNGVQCFTIIPEAIPEDAGTTTIDIMHKVNGAWVKCRRYEVNNTCLSGTATRTVTKGVNTTEYVSSVLTAPNDNIMYDGYQGKQFITYTLDSGYSYTEGDYVGVFMDMELDGVKQASNRAGMREAINRSSKFTGRCMSCDISSDRTFIISTWYSYITHDIKPGEYKFKAIVFDSDDEPQSQPFDISIVVKSVPKAVGSVSSTGTVKAGANNEVDIPFTGSKCNLSTLQVYSVENINVNGVPTDFTKYFDCSDQVDTTGPMWYKSDAPEVTKATKVTGWIKYRYLTPTGWAKGEKKVTITILP